MAQILITPHIGTIMEGNIDDIMKDVRVTHVPTAEELVKGLNDTIAHMETIAAFMTPEQAAIMNKHTNNLSAIARSMSPITIMV